MFQYWLVSIQSVTGAGGRGRIKLRFYMYKTFKNKFETGKYVSVFLPLKHRFDLAKFMCGRFENLPIEFRLSPFCKTTVEDKIQIYIYM